MLDIRKYSLRLLFLSVVVILLLGCGTEQSDLGKNTPVTTEFNTLSEEFLKRIKEGRDTKTIQDRLANTSLTELSNTLVTDEQRFAFWINIYNGYIQLILKEHPEYYQDRDNFFSTEQIPIAGEMISFSKIEHGILRKSQWAYGFGYFRKILPNTFERKSRVNQRDYRIHFALNCGAKDCPPVAIYTPERLEQQFEKGSKLFLERSSHYDERLKKVVITPLFSWFKGDFDGKSGIKKVLLEKGIIPENKTVAITYATYDWTLALNNFIEL